MQAIRTRFIPCTNTRGSRVQAKCEARTIYREWDHALDSTDNHKAACEALLTLLGWNVYKAAPMVGGQFGADHYWVFSGEAHARTVGGAS